MSCPAGQIAACDFTQFLVDQQPHYDQLILEDVTPADSWIANVKTGVFEAHTGVEHTIDRFRDVFPDTTRPWRKTQDANCIGTPCDKPRNVIGWGADRKTYFLEEQNWQSDLLCFDQVMHITHSVEHFSQIIAKILKPATLAIQSTYMRKRALQTAGLTWFANQFGGSGDSKSLFTFFFTVDPVTGGEIFFDCSVNPNVAGATTGVNSLGLLTPQMLQNRFEPLMKVGYAGANPFKDTAPFIELVTDINTCWSLDRLGGAVGVGGSGNPSVVGNWRFEQWGTANKYWRYGFSGQFGNFMVRTDWAGLRFNFLQDLGAAAAPNRFRYQVVQPYINVITTGAGGAAGLGRIENPAFDRAQYAISYIWHKMAMEFQVADATPMNSQMPFSNRDFGGKWQFVMDNLGADKSGVAIANFLRNKGMFVADFKQCVRPLNTEWVEGIFHKREPNCVLVVQPCNPEPGYPTQSYNSANTQCSSMTFNLSFVPTIAVHADGTASTYEIVANNIRCDNEPLTHVAITGATTLLALAAQLTAALPATFGTWSVTSLGGGTNNALLLSGSPCSNIELDWIETVGA
jgi:hypothetical protein